MILYHAHWKAEYKSVCFNTSGLNVTIHFDILKSPISFNIKETTNTNFCNFVLSLENYWKQWSIEDFHLEQFFEDNEQRWENKKKDVVKQIELYIDEQIRPQGYVTSIHVYNKVVVSIELRKGLRADFYLPFIDCEDGLRELTENIGKFKTLIENIPVPIKIVFNKDKGFVKLSYKAIATDERGYPLIPDLASYQEAIYWYVMMKLSFPKFLKG